MDLLTLQVLIRIDNHSCLILIFQNSHSGVNIFLSFLSVFTFFVTSLLKPNLLPECLINLIPNLGRGRLKPEIGTGITMTTFILLTNDCDLFQQYFLNLILKIILYFRWPL